MKRMCINDYNPVVVFIEKQLLEGLLVGKESYSRGSAEVMELARKPRIEQGRLFE
jgi:hypothetical protein